jgi:DNA-binding LytR/AlgR family response regulator
VEAVKKAREKIEEQNLHVRLKKLEEKIGELGKARDSNKLPVYRVNGLIDYLDTETILYLEAEHSICRFHLNSGQLVTSIKNLGFYKDGITGKLDFLQISKKHIVNPAHIQSYDPVNGKILLDNGTNLNVSRRKGKKLREYFKKMI